MSKDWLDSLREHYNGEGPPCPSHNGKMYGRAGAYGCEECDLEAIESEKT